MEAIRFDSGLGRARGWVLALAAAAWLAGCGGDDDAPPPPPPPAQGSATLDAAGGFVDGPDGVRLALPPEAATSAVTFRIARDGSGAPAVPEGVDLVSAVYAITPHGQEFNLPVAVRVPSNPSLAAGRATFLMKAAPGGRWAVIGTDTASATALQASISSLSYFAVGACTNNLPPNSIGAQNCPTSNVLRFELLTDGGTPFPVSQDTTTGAIQPVLLITTPTTLTGRITWTRAPLSFARTDRLNTGSRFTGTGGGVVIERQAGIAWSSEAPDGLDVTQNVTRTFTITVTPAQVAGAANPNGVVRPLWAQAVAGPWEYDAVLPIRVRAIGGNPPAAPVITQQPANASVVEGQSASFAVTATGTGLTYQWLRRADANAAFAPIAGATQASVSTGATVLADSGAQFQVQVCAGTAPCVTSNAATLTVTRAPVLPSFTQQPANVAVVAGQTASFTAIASGVPAPSIRWQTAAAGSSTFTDVTATGCAETPAPGSGSSTTATCTVGPFATGDNGRRYRALAINAVAAPGVPSNEATLTVTPAPSAPSITTQPAPQSTTVGGSATFTVVASGTAPLGYTWRINGTELSNAGSFTIGACTGTVSATGASLTLTGLSAGCSGTSVTVVVANGVNPDATSNPATLTVNAPGGPGLALLAGSIGGPGTVDGTGSEARLQFTFTSGIAVDAAGTVYFSDPIANRLRRITAAGVVTTFADVLLAPAGVAVDGAGNAYLAERARHRILRFAANGTVSVWAGSGAQGTLDGTGTQAQLSNPEYLTIDGNGNLYVTENAGFAPRIRRISAAQEVTLFHDFGGSDGVNAIAAAADGSVYGLGTGALSNTVQRIAPGGVVSLIAGGAGQDGNVDGTGAAARFNLPMGLVFGADGNLYVTDGNNAAVRRVTPAGAVTTVSGTRVFPAAPADGTGTAGRYGFPTAIGRAPNGDLLVGDFDTMRRLTPSFVLTTFVGQRVASGTTDGSGSAARFRGPGGVALDAAGNAYVTDLDRIRVVTLSGVVSTLVTQQQAQFIVRDVGAGFVIASSNAVWRMTAAGVRTLLAGDPTFSDYVDAPVGTDARFGAIRGLTVDGSGNVFVVETINANATVRRITPAGEVTTWAGAKDAPSDIVDGDRLVARFGSPTGGIAVDAGGDLLVADFSAFTGASLLRRITPQGLVSTFVTGGALRPALSLTLAPDGSLLAGGDATLQRISAGGAVTTLVGTQSVRGVKLGAAPNLSLVSGLAVRANGQVLITSEAAVLELTLP